MNKSIFIGRIASDLELNQTANGIPRLSFRLAVPRRFKDANGERQADFFPCVAWRQTAEVIHKFFHKGDKLGVVGTLQNREYVGQDGLKRYITELVVEEFEGCGSPQARRESSEGSEVSKPSEGQGFAPIEDESELPF